MSQETNEADIAPDLKSSEANALDYEHNHFRALHRRLEAAAEALKRVRDQLRARASWGQGYDHDGTHDGPEAGEPEPDGGGP